MAIEAVIWDFGGERIPKRLLRAMERVSDELEAGKGCAAELTELLAEEEVEGLVERTRELLKQGTLPELRRRRSVPWSYR